MILPGMLLLAEAFGVMSDCCMSCRDLFHEGLSCVAAYSIVFCLLAGYLLNALASMCTRDSAPAVPSAITKKINFNETKTEQWHYIKDYTSPSEKIEEYFVHFCQARNLMFAFGVCTFIMLLFLIARCDVAFLVAFLVNLVLTIFMNNVYKRHKRRYHQVFLAEFVKEYNKNNPEDKIDFSEIYK